MPLPGQHLLKCEVLAALGAAHQLLGELEFQRRCYTKGLEQHKDPSANSADRCVSNQGLLSWPCVDRKRFQLLTRSPCCCA